MSLMKKHMFGVNGSQIDIAHHASVKCLQDEGQVGLAVSISSHPRNTEINSFKIHPMATKYSSLTVTASNIIIKYFRIKIILESL